MAWTDLGTLATGSQSKIEGLPFLGTAGTGLNQSIDCSYAYGLNTTSGSQVTTGMVNANTQYIIMHKWSHYSGVQPLNFAHVSDEGSIVLGGFYETAS